MKPSLNGVIFGQGLSPDEQIDVASAVGFEGIDIGIDAVAGIVEARSLAGAKELFEEKGVQPAAWGLPVSWLGSEDDYRDSMTALPKWAKVAEEIGYLRCCTWIPPTAADPAQRRKEAIARFGESAMVLADHGVRLGLEWVGPKTSRSSGEDFIYTMDQLLDMIGEMNQPNIGLLVDSFHWFTAGHTVEDLTSLTKDQVVHVHINDAPNKPRDEQIDMQRLLPGEGVIDLAGFLSALRQVGYTDYMGVETFSDTLKALPPEDAARKAKEAAESVL